MLLSTKKLKISKHYSKFDLKWYKTESIIFAYLSLGDNALLPLENFKCGAVEIVFLSYFPNRFINNAKTSFGNKTTWI